MSKVKRVKIKRTVIKRDVFWFVPIIFTFLLSLIIFFGDAGIPKVIDGFMAGVLAVMSINCLFTFLKGNEKVVVEEAELM